GHWTNVSLCKRPSPDPAGARLRARRAVAPAPARPPLRRRAHGLIPVLLAPGRGTRAAACPVPRGRRLARALDARLLPRVARRLVRLEGAAALPARAAACVLVFA